MLRTIEIEYIKGIRHKSFQLDILPNKPSLLVAPNGFGKSSFAAAFRSMNNRRIDLKEDDFYEENATHAPKVRIEYRRPDNTIVQLEATRTTNAISPVIDYFVISNPTKPKGIGSMHGRATATLEIKDVVLVDTIPPNPTFGYLVTGMRTSFGVQGRVLPNISPLLANHLFVEKIAEHFDDLRKANGKMIQNSINAVITDINAQQGNADQVTDWIANNRMDELDHINYLNTIKELIAEHSAGFGSDAKNYMAAIQLVWLYNNDPARFKDACTFSAYQLERERFNTTLATFNSTWKDIRTSETGGQLVVKFPKAIHISNGQRDILTFVSMLFRARRHLKKDANILIIDEVFDYLDDANLTAAQYYITQFIKNYKEQGKRIYPLILTHLNPAYFKNFAFGDQKVYYLDKSSMTPNQYLVKLLRNREQPSIVDDVARHLFHYHPAAINKRAEFEVLNLREVWGEGDSFRQFLNGQLQNYLNGQPYCPFAVCGAVRVKIEEKTYQALPNDAAKTQFLEVHKTRSKLEKAESFGILSPESHYLLGVIYNEGMHWKENFDNVSPIAGKLENLTIKKLIRDI